MRYQGRRSGLRRTLYIHVGPAKTGTSAIQHVLCRHDGSVVLYPRVGLWADGSHHNLVLNFFGDYKRAEVVRQNPRDLLAKLGEQAKATDRDIVISSEVLAGRKGVGAFASALQAVIGHEIRTALVVVVRDHLDRAASVYAQRVRDPIFAEQRDPDRFLTDTATNLCYANLLRSLGETGLEVCVLNYHPAGGCLARVLETFGFAPHQIPESPARNVFPAKEELLAALVTNRLPAHPKERRRFDEALRKGSGWPEPAERVLKIFRRAAPDVNRAFAETTPRTSIFGADAIAAVQCCFDADRNTLCEQFQVELPAPDSWDRGGSFTIGEREFARIAAATRSFGAYGASIRDAARRYAKGSSD